MVTRPLIESIASITRPRWRNGVGSRQWCKQATRTIISGMGDPFLCRVGLGIHRLHWAQSPCLIAVYYAVVLPHLLFGEGIDKGVVAYTGPHVAAPIYRPIEASQCLLVCYFVQKG